MKHGFYVMGKDENGHEFSYGKNETKHQVMKAYAWSMASKNITDEVKKTLRIVELVEKDITKEYYE
jgi:hypothetical protein